MGDDKGYKDTKEFTCVGCGKKIILTKFASQKTCKCDECKANNVPINPDIVAEALKINPPKERKKSSEGETKICSCIKCGKMVEVTKFATPSKVLCDECKGTSSGKAVGTVKVDKSRLPMVNIAPIEEYEANVGIIKNERLRKVKCPACGHEYMKPLMIIDWSQFGLVIDYQCQFCYAKMFISEQCTGPTKIYKPGKRFDYAGNQIRGMAAGFAESTRMGNALKTIIGICDEHNINLDSFLDEFKDTVPPYKWNNEKPVPTGFVIPPEDKFMSVVKQAVDILKSPLDATSDDYISISSEDARLVVDKLNNLLKGDSNGQE